MSAIGRRTTLFSWIAMVLFTIVLSVFIGLRFEVGKDWHQYVYLYDLLGSMSLGEALMTTDSGYALMNWIFGQQDMGPNSVFLVCAIILSVGIFLFAKETPYPWMAIAVAIPHIVTVMAMDHVRQATAVGFILIGLAYLARDRVWPFLICVLLGAMFHRTSIIVFAFGMVLISKNKFLIYPIFAAAGAVMFQSLLSDRLDLYSSRYIESEFYGSRGALLRLLLNAMPAVGFLVFRKRMVMNPKYLKVMTYMAWTSILLVVILPLSPSPVIIDRLGKYFLPVQMLFFPYFLSIFRGYGVRCAIAAVMTFYLFFTQVYWLSKSPLAQDYWMPYQNLSF
ncbi:EpsG family protein [Tropicibacter oceani]|uniref:EpsG family protein n=1 Tax=Tropicibacter oceani TaxID=3058420 RepID=A0ABY8QKG0_9RHOB|nr:EpsG family protein [Tropicibacter oceani]WGW04493.1 EpsG family protein [Tropicibacter oceani]